MGNILQENHFKGAKEQNWGKGEFSFTHWLSRHIGCCHFDLLFAWHDEYVFSLILILKII